MARQSVPDELWMTVDPLLPPEPPEPNGGKLRVHGRAVLASLIYFLRDGIPWGCCRRLLRKRVSLSPLRAAGTHPRDYLVQCALKRALKVTIAESLFHRFALGSGETVTVVGAMVSVGTTSTPAALV